MAPRREVRRLPTQQHITEFRYSGRRYSRRKIAQIEGEIKARFPNKKFQILLPYETWKPGSWTYSNVGDSLFSLLDHYDESQVGPDFDDPEYFNQFVIYMRDPDPISGGCDSKKDNGNNDC